MLPSGSSQSVPNSKASYGPKATVMSSRESEQGRKCCAIVSSAISGATSAGATSAQSPARNWDESECECPSFERNEPASDDALSWDAWDIGVLLRSPPEPPLPPDSAEWLRRGAGMPKPPS